MLFKIASTMDSMVGYKTPRYLRFGWCGARLDDVMNYLPARMTWLLIAAVVVLCSRLLGEESFGSLAGASMRFFPDPNAGWGEAATAGAIQRKLIGPIWANGALVTNVWLGDGGDAAAGEAVDIRRASVLIGATGLLAAVAAVVLTYLWRSFMV